MLTESEKQTIRSIIDQTDMTLQNDHVVNGTATDLEFNLIGYQTQAQQKVGPMIYFKATTAQNLKWKEVADFIYSPAAYVRPGVYNVWQGFQNRRIAGRANDYGFLNDPVSVNLANNVAIAGFVVLGGAVGAAALAPVAASGGGIAGGSGLLTGQNVAAIGMTGLEAGSTAGIIGGAGMLEGSIAAATLTAAGLSATGAAPTAAEASILQEAAKAAEMIIEPVVAARITDEFKRLISPQPESGGILGGDGILSQSNTNNKLPLYAGLAFGAFIILRELI